MRLSMRSLALFTARDRFLGTTASSILPRGFGILPPLLAAKKVKKATTALGPPAATPPESLSTIGSQRALL
jgi:hypothetical protein